MRSKITVLFALYVVICVGQTTRFYKPGQVIPNTPNTGLLLKHDGKKVNGLSRLKDHPGVKIIKFVAFNSATSGLDSTLKLVAGHLSPHTIIFEDCDLNTLNTFLDIFPDLTSLSITKHSAYFENSLFTYLSRNKLKSIAVQADDEEFLTDSLHLLKHLEVLDISSNHLFTKPNKTDRYQFYVNGSARAVTINYYGSLYKNYKDPLVKRAATAPAKVSAINAPKAPPVNFECIRQPLPGVNINDTVYSVVAQHGGSFYYGSGSKIKFDKNAFVNADGSDHKGAVSVFYREFRNPVEIMLSGIPMVVKDGNADMIFKSGGMYEINAVDVNGNQLRTRSDTSVKINFALTDTSSEFKFYSLSNSGNWSVAANSVSTMTSDKRKGKPVERTKAVDEYVKYLFTRKSMLQDTTPFQDRFGDQEYIYCYRKDNLKHYKDSTRYDYLGYGIKKSKGSFRIRYVARTKDHELIFKIVPTSDRYYHEIPKHIRYLVNRQFVYSGKLDRQQFKEQFCKNKGYWDLRTEVNGGEITFTLKTDKGFTVLEGEPIAQYDRKKVVRQDARPIQARMDKTLAQEAKKFNRNLKSRRQKNDLNILSPRLVTAEQAWTHSQKFQNQEEKAMTFSRWQTYVKPFLPSIFNLEQLQNNAVGNALLKSGLGIKNIDAYIHKSQMEPVFVNYNNATIDSSGTGYHAMLYRSINTSFPLTTGFDSNELSGYYFKDRPNYVIRFSGNGYMQVTKPEQLKSSKKGGKIVIDYKEEFYVKNMNSNEITQLILN